MLPVMAALGAISGVTSLIESATAKVGNSISNEFSSLTSGGAQTPSLPSATATKFDPATLSALLSAQGQNGTSASSWSANLFKKLDTNGDGSISKSEFESALGSAGVDSTQADALFNKLDANGDGSISQSELTPKRSAYMHSQHGHGAGGAGGSSAGGSAGNASSLANATNADGSTTQTTTNPDGSTTTTITYADGSTVSTTSAAAQSGASKGNMLQKLIQMQSALISTQAAALA